MFTQKKKQYYSNILGFKHVDDFENFSKQKSKKGLRWYGKYGIIRCAVIGSQGGGTNA